MTSPSPMKSPDRDAADDPVTALTELCDAVFGSHVGDEPDVYADYDRLCELKRKSERALSELATSRRRVAELEGVLRKAGEQIRDHYDPAPPWPDWMPAYIVHALFPPTRKE